MSIINFKHREDYGHDWYAQIFNTGKHVPKFMKQWSLLQVSVSWNEYAGWPYIHIKSGCGSILSIVFWAYKFGFDIDIFARTWDWDYLKQVNEDELV